MDILYLSNERLNQLRQICSDNLLKKVLESFASKHRIIEGSKEHPSGLWCLEEFLKEPPCHRIYKAFVFVAFAYLGGFFMFNEEPPLFGDMNLLKEMLVKGYIYQEEYDDFVHIIYEARQGIKPLWFDLLDVIENAPE